MNVGSDHPILSIPKLDLAEWLDSSKDFDPSGTQGPQENGGADLQSELVDPDWTKTFTNLREVELIAVSKDEPLCDFMMTEIMKGSTDPSFWSWENPKAVEEFTKLFNKWQQDQQKNRETLTEVAKQDHLRNKLYRLVNTTVNELIVRTTKPRTEVQLLSKLLYNQLRQASGSYVPGASSQQLQVAWDYLVNLHNEIVRGGIPKWAK